MAGNPPPSTSQFLILQLTSGMNDPEAWKRFVYLYGPHLVEWCRKYGLQDADARDVSQDVLLQISRQISRLKYDPSKRFRGWLRAIVHSAWCDWVERFHAANVGAADSAIRTRLEQVPARDELVARLEAEFDRELMELAMQRVRKRVEPKTWRAFELQAMKGVSGEDAAAELEMRLGSAFAARSKVQRMIRDEIEKLESSG